MLVRDFKWVAWICKGRRWEACASSDDRRELARRFPFASILPMGERPKEQAD